VLNGFIVSEVGAFSFGQFHPAFPCVLFFAGFLMRFGMAGFSRELCLARFSFRVLAVFAFFPLVLLLFGFFLVVAVLLAFGNFMRLVESLSFVFVKIRSTNKRVGFGARLRFFVLGFYQAGRERDRLFIAQCWSYVARRFGRSFGCVLNFPGRIHYCMFFRCGFSPGRLGLRFRIG
jgi:hypothetical protein